MSPGEKNKIDHIGSPFSAAASPLLFFITLATIPLLSTGCSTLMGGIPANREVSSGGGILKGLRPAADPALVERIRENERKEAEKQASQTVISQTGGAQTVQPGLGRDLPKVSTDPISAAFNSISKSTNATFMAANTQVSNAFANPNPQVATYENAYSAVPPPPPGSLAAGLVPPPPAVSLSTQAQTYGGDSAANFYNNPYFNPYGVPAPPQTGGAERERRPVGLFGNGGNGASRSQAEPEVEKTSNKHRADFVPITPTGMEARSAYKQRDDLRLLWRAAVKDSNDAGAIADNTHLIADLAKLDIGLPSDSSRGNFNVSSRQIETLFKSSAIDKRVLPEVRKIQTDLVQAYYRYLSAYNKYALAEQTTAARQQEADLSDSDSERQRATADLAQAKNDFDSTKDDMRSAEFELAAASSPAAARTVISHIAGVAPSVESLAQGSSQSGNRLATSRTHKIDKIANVFDSVFRHNHGSSETDAAVEEPKVSAKERNKNKKLSHNKDRDNDGGLEAKKDKKFVAKNTDNDNDYDLAPAPVSKKQTHADSDDVASDTQEPVKKSNSTSNSTISFELKGINIKPRKSVLTVAVKNSSDEAYELNPDTICISEGNHKLPAADMRADFDLTSVQPDHEVKGTITVFGHPWNDRLLVYLDNGNKKIQLKR